MVQRDHYIILGVSPTAPTRSIQRAFRPLAKQYHPDRVGPQGTSTFQDIVEAYEVLSNPERREVYDSHRRLMEPAERYWAPPEPLIPEPSSHGQRLWDDPLRREQPSLFDDFMTFQPSFEALRARMLRNFTGVGVPKGEHVDSLNVEVVLSPDEARRGGILRLGIPVFVPCPMCAGTRHAWNVACLACMGEGMREQEEVVAVRLPPQVQHGAIFERSLYGLGLHNFYLRLHIAVTARG
jgi:molecular chaperone DnaJ